MWSKFYNKYKNQPCLKTYSTSSNFHYKLMFLGCMMHVFSSVQCTSSPALKGNNLGPMCTLNHLVRWKPYEMTNNWRFCFTSSCWFDYCNQILKAVGLKVRAQTFQSTNTTRKPDLLHSEFNQVYLKEKFHNLNEDIWGVKTSQSVELCKEEVVSSTPRPSLQFSQDFQT